MPLTNVGQISLDDIHVEAGGTSLSQAGINDADIRGLIGAGSATEMEFSDWYGASGNATFKGSVIGNHVNDINFVSFANVNTIAAVGDLCIIAIASDLTLDAPNVSITGMTATKLSALSSGSPGWLLAYGFRQSGDSNTIGFSTTSDDGLALCGVLAVFGGISSLNNYAVATQIFGVPNPPSLNSASPTKLIVTTAHVDDDYVLMTAPSGYSLARANRGTNNNNVSNSAVAVAYKITSTSQAENPSTFGGGASDFYTTYTLRFQ